MFYKERKRYLMVEVLQEIGAQYIGTQGEFGIFLSPPKQYFLKIGPLTLLMVMISFPKVNNAIPDRFLMFLSYQNDFLTL